MRLINPLTGLAVDAEGDTAKLLMERGFTPEKPARKRQPARTTRKRETPKRGE